MDVLGRAEADLSEEERGLIGSKAYVTRVGNGPFPTELGGEEGTRLREIGAGLRALTSGAAGLLVAEVVALLVGPTV